MRCDADGGLCGECAETRMLVDTCGAHGSDPCAKSLGQSVSQSDVRARARACVRACVRAYVRA
eukprot:6136542-Pleurochrysis_carterae.AAC.4